MKKQTGNLILLLIISICLVSLVIFSLIQLFLIDLISGIFGVIFAIGLNIIMINLLFKPKKIKLLDIIINGELIDDLIAGINCLGERRHIDYERKKAIKYLLKTFKQTIK